MPTRELVVFAARVAAALGEIPGVEDVLASGLGHGARVIEERAVEDCATGDHA
jgi:hypothetical protein